MTTRSLSRPSTLTEGYIGRFAPSPSGPLHFGSLVCALGSYLDAKSAGGKWLVRIDDIDPPREQPGASDGILASLQHHGLQWDDEVFYQSQQSSRYHSILGQLEEKQLAYGCQCSRKRLQSLSYVYDGHCLQHPPEAETPCAIRLNLEACRQQFPELSQEVNFADGIQGPIKEDITQLGDFVIHRKDGLFAYQLAVVADDIHQGITHIVRGADLLETTAKQLYFIELLSQQRPHYTHIPVVLDDSGRKLSKQNHAPPLDSQRAFSNLIEACVQLQLGSPPEDILTQAALLNWATERWATRYNPVNCGKDQAKPFPTE